MDPFIIELESRRHKAGMSKAEFAQALGMSHSNYNHLVNGRKFPSHYLYDYFIAKCEEHPEYLEEILSHIFTAAADKYEKEQADRVAAMRKIA